MYILLYPYYFLQFPLFLKQVKERGGENNMDKVIYTYYKNLVNENKYIENESMPN